MKTDQRGFAHLPIILLAAAVILGVGFAFWRINSKVSSGNNDHLPVVTDSITNLAKCKQVVKDSNICKFAASFNPKASYKAIDISNTTEGNGTLTILSDGKGNSAVDSSAGGANLSFVLLNGDTYIKNSDGWTKYAASGATSPSAVNPVDGLKISAADINGHGTISYKNLGSEACGSQTCFKYQIVDATQPDTTEYVWFDNQKFQLHEYYIKNANGSNDITFTYQAVTISTPSPITSTN